jgi:hypothetical protein
MGQSDRLVAYGKHQTGKMDLEKRGFLGIRRLNSASAASKNHLVIGFPPLVGEEEKYLESNQWIYRSCQISR